MGTSERNFCFFLYCNAFVLILFFCGCLKVENSDKLSVEFDKGYGQVEVGGKFTGLEFHHSRPAPSRINFYYPVANSIDLSEDYWKRDLSLPFSILITSGKDTDTLQVISCPYEYTPYKIIFHIQRSVYDIDIKYNMCENLPSYVFELRLLNKSDKEIKYIIQTDLNTTIRSSHSFDKINTSKITYQPDRSMAVAYYPYIASDSSCLFVRNAGIMPENEQITPDSGESDKELRFRYDLNLKSGEHAKIIQLTGMCGINETDKIITDVYNNWKQEIQQSEQRIIDFVFNSSYFSTGEEVMQHTLNWSKALCNANIHYIDDHFIPMPCPVEYNFFFTHDLLLTSLGIVYFDPQYVKNGLFYLKSLTGNENILPHAYYWKDNQYITEFCGSDNWNHLWFIIVCSSYLKHSGDRQTIALMYPILQKSLETMLSNKGQDNLMYAKRPDWWDIGDVYGARAYISVLMYKALQEYVYIMAELGQNPDEATKMLQIAYDIKTSINEYLWDDKAGYIFNEINRNEIDKHYYAGSILAVYYDILNHDRKKQLLKTVENELLDPRIGIRNAMPPDFHLLEDLYRFKKNEVGQPYFYFNGAVWPHNNYWYIWALIANNQPDAAFKTLSKYMTLEGIRNSPNGTPSFFEYRITDPNSQRYGEIDKPSFLWAGGLYINVLYQLMGARKNANTIYFSPALPTGFPKVEYDISLSGRFTRVKYLGFGPYFKKITADGEKIYSAVFYRPYDNINFYRGLPESPYIAESNVRIKNITFTPENAEMQIILSGYKGQPCNLKIVSGREIANIKSEAYYKVEKYLCGDMINTYEIQSVMRTKENKITLHFN